MFIIFLVDFIKKFQKKKEFGYYKFQKFEFYTLKEILPYIKKLYRKIEVSFKDNFQKFKSYIKKLYTKIKVFVKDNFQKFKSHILFIKKLYMEIKVSFKHKFQKISTFIRPHYIS